MVTKSRCLVYRNVYLVYSSEHKSVHLAVLLHAETPRGALASRSGRLPRRVPMQALAARHSAATRLSQGKLQRSPHLTGKQQLPKLEDGRPERRLRAAHHFQRGSVGKPGRGGGRPRPPAAALAFPPLPGVRV